MKNYSNQMPCIKTLLILKRKETIIMANKKSTLRRNRASNFWGTIKRLISYMSNRAWWILVVFILSAGAAILSAQLPLVMGNITTTIFEGLGVETGVDFQVVGRLIVTLGSFYVFSAVFRYLQQFITARISQHRSEEHTSDLQSRGDLVFSLMLE